MSSKNTLINSSETAKNSYSETDAKIKQQTTESYQIANPDAFQEQFNGYALSKRIDDLESQLSNTQEKIDELSLEVDNLKKFYELLKAQINQIEVEKSNYHNGNPGTTTSSAVQKAMADSGNTSVDDTTGINPGGYSPLNNVSADEIANAFLKLHVG